MNSDSDVFSCKMCGQCCQGRGGIVLSDRDVARLAGFLGRDAESTKNLYAEISNGKLKIKSGEDGFCVFFKAGSGCSIHAGKPDICRAWPFFRGNLEDPYSLALARDYCPGIKEDVSFECFRNAGLEYLRANSLLATNCEREASSLVISVGQINS